MNDLFDDDGYPTDEALDAIAKWRPPEGSTDMRPWFALVKSAWHSPGWGWHEEPGMVDEHMSGRLVTRYLISTGGWSGNESVIGAMQRNRFGWLVTWQQSRRGGHYIFDALEPT